MNNNSNQVSYQNTEIQPFYIGSAYVSISEDGSLLASAINEEIIISNLPEGRIVGKLPGDGEDVTCLQITPDGEKLAILSASQQAQIYDVTNELITNSFKLTSPVYATGVDQTSTLFAFGGTDGLIQVWDIDNGYITHSLKGHSSIISSLKFYGELNSDKWLLISGDSSGIIKVWDLVKRKCIATLNEHNTAVRGLEISPDFKYLVSGGRDNILNIFEISQKSNNYYNFKIWKSIPTSQSIESCGFINQVGQEEEQASPSYVYFGGDKNYLQIYDFIDNVSAGRSVIPLENTEELMINSIFKISGSRLVLVLSDQTVKYLNLQDAKITEAGNTNNQYFLPFDKTYAGNHGIITSLAFVGQEYNHVALASNSPSLRIIHPFGNQLEVEILEGHTDDLTTLSVSEDGSWLATASKDRDARLWRLNLESNTFENVAVFKGHSAQVTAVAMSNVFIGGGDNFQPSFIITGSNDLTIKKWEVPKTLYSSYVKQQKDLERRGPVVINHSKHTRKAHEKDINSIDISPNDEIFATASFDKSAKIWDTQTCDTIGILRGHKRSVWKVQFCPFDKVILTCSGDKSLKLWSLQTYQCLKTFEGHSNSVLDCKFINRKKILSNDVSNGAAGDNLEIVFKKSFNEIISCGADGLIKLWDMKSGEILKTFDDHIDKIWCMASKKNSNGEWFISADCEGMINLWKDNTLELLKEKQKSDKAIVEQQQSLENFIRLEDWQNAFKLALKLKHPMKLYTVLKSSIESSSTSKLGSVEEDGPIFLGSKDLDACIKELDTSGVKIIFEKLRNWNTNFKFFEISQKLVKCILFYHSIEDLVEIPGLMRIIESVIPYNQRHYQRIDSLIEDSYILDYTIQEMNRLIV